MDLNLQALISDLERAQNKFNDAGPDHIDIAIRELMEAEERLNQYIRAKKEKKIREKTFKVLTRKID